MIDRRDEERFEKRLAKLLRYHRVMAGLTQRKLEARMGLTTSVVSIYETHTRTPRLGTLLAFAKGLGVDIRDLVPSSLNEDDDPKLPRHYLRLLDTDDSPSEPALPEFDGAIVNVPDSPDPPPKLGATNGAVVDHVDPLHWVDPDESGKVVGDSVKEERPAEMPWNDAWEELEDEAPEPPKAEAEPDDDEDEDW